MITLMLSRPFRGTMARNSAPRNWNTTALNLHTRTRNRISRHGPCSQCGADVYLKFGHAGHCQGAEAVGSDVPHLGVQTCADGLGLLSQTPVPIPKSEPKSEARPWLVLDRSCHRQKRAWRARIPDCGKILLPATVVGLSMLRSLSMLQALQLVNGKRRQAVRTHAARRVLFTQVRHRRRGLAWRHLEIQAPRLTQDSKHSLIAASHARVVRRPRGGTDDSVPLLVIVAVSCSPGGCRLEQSVVFCVATAVRCRSRWSSLVEIGLHPRGWPWPAVARRYLHTEYVL